MTKKEFYDRFKVRPLSYSQLSCFDYSPKEWHTRYILGQTEPPNPAMLFGSNVGDSIGTEASLVPSLNPPGIKEYELRASLKNIHLVGFADHYDPVTQFLSENKTSDRLDRWTAKKVHDHKQLDMYALLLFLQDKVKPEDLTIQLNFIPVEVTGDFQYRMPEEPYYIPFQTTRTTQDIVAYTQYIMTTVERMYEYLKTI